MKLELLIYCLILLPFVSCDFDDREDTLAIDRSPPLRGETIMWVHKRSCARVQI